MRTAAALAAALALPAAAAASTTIATNAQQPALRVDALGNAEVDWTAGGARRTVLIPAQGQVFPGRKLPGPDASQTATAAIPFARVVRRTGDGRLWALQAWQVQPGGPVELRFARWRGAPPTITLTVENGDTLTGAATFQGKPVTGFATSFEGKRMRIYVYLDAFMPGGWKRVGGVAPRGDGSFRRLIPPAFTAAAKFRATVTGPTSGTTIAPDASVVTTV
jgi:hypothetical protein